MALLFMDTFDHYITADILKKWTANIGVSGIITNSSAAALAYPGGGSVYTSNTGGNNVGMRKTLPSTYATGVIGGWFYYTSQPTSIDVTMALGDAGSPQLKVCGNGSGKLTVQRGGDYSGTAGTVLATSANTLSLNTWYHIELKATIDNTTGVIQLKVNGTDWIASTSGLNTRNTANNYFGEILGPKPATGSNGNISSKLIYVCDTSGTVANDFLGVCRGVCINPASAGNYAQWTPNSGANFYTVKETVNDGDLSYNSTATANNIDSFVMSDLPSGSGTIFGVQTIITAKQDAGAARTMAPFWRISSTDYVGTTVSLTASYAMFIQVYTLSPATSAAWTVSELNAAESGYKLIS